MVIELLRFRFRPEQLQDFLDKNATIWTPALQQHRGFVDKEIWTNVQTPGEVLVAIHWATMEDWKSFPAALCAKLDGDMGPDFQVVDGYEYEVVASTIRPV